MLLSLLLMLWAVIFDITCWILGRIDMLYFWIVLYFRNSESLSVFFGFMIQTLIFMVFGYVKCNIIVYNSTFNSSFISKANQVFILMHVLL